MKIERPTLILAWLCLLWFIALNTRTPIGADSYNYLAFVFDHNNTLLNKNPLVETIFGALPASFLAWNALAAIVLFASCFMVGQMGKLFNARFGEYGSLIAFNTILFPVFLTQLEPLALAMPLLLAATYLFFKHGQTMSPLAWAFLLAGCFIWLGGGFFLIAFGLYQLPMLLLGAIGVAQNASTMLNGLLPNLGVAENYPVYGGLALLLLFGVTLYTPKQGLDWRQWFKFKVLDRMKRIMVFFGAISVLSFKFVSLAIPIFSANRATFIKEDELPAIQFFSVAVLAVMVWNLPNLIPTRDMVDSVKYGLDYSKDGNVQNDWSIGHYVKFYGGTPSLRYGPPQSTDLLNPDFSYLRWFDCDTRPVITSQDLNSQFQKVKNFGAYSIYVCKRDGHA